MKTLSVHCAVAGLAIGLYAVAFVSDRASTNISFWVNLSITIVSGRTFCAAFPNLYVRLAVCSWSLALVWSSVTSESRPRNMRLLLEIALLVALCYSSLFTSRSRENYQRRMAEIEQRSAHPLLDNFNGKKPTAFVYQSFFPYQESDSESVQANSDYNNADCRDKSETSRTLPLCGFF